MTWNTCPAVIQCVLLNFSFCNKKHKSIRSKRNEDTKFLSGDLEANHYLLLSLVEKSDDFGNELQMMIGRWFSSVSTTSLDLTTSLWTIKGPVKPSVMAVTHMALGSDQLKWRFILSRSMMGCCVCCWLKVASFFGAILPFPKGMHWSLGNVIQWMLRIAVAQLVCLPQLPVNSLVYFDLFLHTHRTVSHTEIRVRLRTKQKT